MDPLALATTTVGIIAPLLGQLADKASTALTDRASADIVRLYEVMREKLAGKPRAQKVLEDANQNPTDPEVLEDLTTHIKRMVEQDEAFAKQLTTLIETIQKQSGVPTGGTTYTVTNTGSGSVVQGGGAAASHGGIAIGGNLHGGLNKSDTTAPTSSSPAAIEATLAPETRALITRIREGLLANYSLDDIRILIFDIEGFDYDTLPGSTHPTKVHNLVLQVHHRGKLEELRALIRTQRPHLGL